MNLKNKTQLSLVAFTAVSLVVIAFLIYPIFEDVKKNSVELSFKEQDLGYLESKLKNINDFKKTHASIKADIDKGRDLFATAEAPVNFISFLEQIALDSYADIAISPSPVVSDSRNPWEYILFQISAFASFDDYMRFLEKIESGPFLVQVENLSISRLTERDIQSQELSQYSVGDVRSILTLKVFAD